MKLGIGLYPNIWNDAHLAMAAQFGCQIAVLGGEHATAGRSGA